MKTEAIVLISVLFALSLFLLWGFWVLVSEGEAGAIFPGVLLAFCLTALILIYIFADKHGDLRELCKETERSEGTGMAGPLPTKILFEECVKISTQVFTEKNIWEDVR